MEHSSFLKTEAKIFLNHKTAETEAKRWWSLQWTNTNSDHAGGQNPLLETVFFWMDITDGHRHQSFVQSIMDHVQPMISYNTSLDVDNIYLTHNLSSAHTISWGHQTSDGHVQYLLDIPMASADVNDKNMHVDMPMSFVDINDKNMSHLYQPSSNSEANFGTQNRSDSASSISETTQLSVDADGKNLEEIMLSNPEQSGKSSKSATYIHYPGRASMPASMKVQTAPQCHDCIRTGQRCFAQMRFSRCMECVSSNEKAACDHASITRELSHFADSNQNTVSLPPCRTCKKKEKNCVAQIGQRPIICSNCMATHQRPCIWPSGEGTERLTWDGNIAKQAY